MNQSKGHSQTIGNSSGPLGSTSIRTDDHRLLVYQKFEISISLAMYSLLGKTTRYGEYAVRIKKQLSSQKDCCQCTYNLVCLSGYNVLGLVVRTYYIVSIWLGKFFRGGVIQIVNWYILMAVVSQCAWNSVFVTYEKALILRVMEIHSLGVIDISFLSYVEI